MTIPIKPTKVFLNFLFQCKCGHDIYISLKEWKFVGRAICEFCGAKIYLAPLEDFKVKPIYKEGKNSTNIENRCGKHRVKTEPITKPIETAKNVLSDDLIASLINLGFKKKEAERRIEKSRFVLGSNVTDEEILRHAIL